jgi:hypothetical protein
MGHDWRDGAGLGIDAACYDDVDIEYLQSMNEQP